MNDKEIKKIKEALEYCCAADWQSCDSCPFYKQCLNYGNLHTYSLKLIDHLEAELASSRKHTELWVTKFFKKKEQLETLIKIRGNIEKTLDMYDGLEMVSKISAQIFEAVDKQFPNKAIAVEVGKDKIKIDGGMWCEGTTIYKCPCCGYHVNITYNYCKNCGQRLAINADYPTLGGEK